MFRRLVSHNPDLAQLVDTGYAVGFDTGFLIIRDIPYLDQELELQIGALVSKLIYIDADHVRQDDHQVFFAGSVPYGLDGSPIPNLGGGPIQLALGKGCADVIVQRSFSNKPFTGAFSDLFDKMESYVTLISGPAVERYGDATPKTYRSVEDMPADSVFKFQDTLTSRAEIGDLSRRLGSDVVAIIGLGGTGAYVLDFLARTPVREIKLYDVDDFHVHNAFRTPGSLDPSDLGCPKVEVCERRYSSFRDGVSANVRAIDRDSAEYLDGVTFAFVCIDKGESRSAVFDLLMARGIPFIDVGMGLHRRNGSLTGILRTTAFLPESAEWARAMGWADLSDEPEDEYNTNIQIAELNALNASLAVIRFKQLRGFYTAEPAFANLLFDISDMKTVAENGPHEA